MGSLLLVEDDDGIRLSLELTLEDEGHRGTGVASAARFPRASQPLAVPRADGAILDARLTAADYQGLVVGS